ncbi:MAG: hypothetical protein WDN04_25235 [Rhodospirillales bacterium]
MQNTTRSARGSHANLFNSVAHLCSGGTRTSLAVAVSVLSFSLACPAAATPLKDGFAGAPAGAPQMPGLLSSYPVRPAWHVAGVDYAAGVPAGTVLKDPATLNLPGVSVNLARHVATVTGAGVVLNGYDFSLEGGWNVYVEGANDIIENCNFKVGINNQVPIQGSTSATNLSVLRSTIDGGGLGVVGNPGAVWSLISYIGNGLTARHNWLKFAPQHIIEFSGGTLIEKYNLINNMGYAPGAHPNAVQFCGGSAKNSVISYNTIYNPQPDGSGYPKMNNEDLQVEGQCTGTVLNTSMTNNVVIATAGAALTSSYLVAVRQDGGSNLVNGVNVQSNFLDSSGAYGPFYPPSGTNLVFANNMNLVTGKPLTEPAGTSQTPALRAGTNALAAHLWAGIDGGTD